MDNRLRLLESTLTLFADRGYDAVGVQELAEAAGVTKPTLYHYFGNKLGLLQALIEHHGTPAMAALSAAADYQGDLPLTLSRVVRTYFQVATRDPLYHRLRLALWVAPEHSEAGQAIAAQAEHERAALTAMFEAATSDHGNMRGRATVYATSLQGVAYAHIACALREGAALDEELAFRVVHQFMHGIYS